MSTAGLVLVISMGVGHFMASPLHRAAFVIPPKLAQLATTSDVIVLAKVESVTGQPAEEGRRATAQVLEAWKGEKVERVEYLASPTFACDIADAKVGERVLLFLEREEDTGWVIAWAGRGRMPLISRDGKEYASAFGDVIFPEGTPEIAIPEAEEDGFDWAVELTLVRQLVSKALEEKPR
jgi:hypothetical protein